MAKDGLPPQKNNKEVTSAEKNIAATNHFSIEGSVIKDRPQRLGLIYPPEPLYFVTFCARDRCPLSSLARAQTALKNYARGGLTEFNIAVGCYVLMPDNIHLFVRGDANFSLLRCVAGLKRAIAIALDIRGKFWQPSFSIMFCATMKVTHRNGITDETIRCARGWSFGVKIGLIRVRLR